MHALQMLVAFTGVAAGLSLPSFLQPRSLEDRQTPTKPKGCPADSKPQNVTLCSVENEGDLCNCGKWLMTVPDYCGNPTADPAAGYNPIYPTAYYPGGECYNDYCTVCYLECPCRLAPYN